MLRQLENITSLDLPMNPLAHHDLNSTGRYIYRTGLLPAWTITTMIIAVNLWWTEIPIWLQYMPFALSIVIFGLPHGAVDHLVPFWISHAHPSWIRMSYVLMAYVACMLLFASLWFVFPAICFVLFILMTWLHWGQGDLYILHRIAASPEPSTTEVETVDAPLYALRLHRVGIIVVRGGLPMLLPLLAFPDIYATIAESTVGLFGGNLTAISWILDSWFRLSVGFVYASTVLCTISLSIRHFSRQVWLLDLFEVLLLTIYFLVVPPLLAVGVYFCFWHSLRHILRLQLIGPRKSSIVSRKNWQIFFRNAAPATIVALLFLPVFYQLVPFSPTSIDENLGLYLVLIASLTFPHVLIVTWMDWKEGVWFSHKCST